MTDEEKNQERDIGLLGARLIARKSAWEKICMEGDEFCDACGGECEEKKQNLFGPNFGSDDECKKCEKKDNKQEINEVSERLYDLTTKGNLNEDEEEEKSELLGKWRSLTGRTDKPRFMQ